MTAASLAVSIKGVLAIDGRFCLLRNARGEWELPGGRPEPDEEPEAACLREIAEELGLAAEIARILDSWRYRVLPERHVLIVTYACRPLSGVRPRASDEHVEYGLFAPAEIEALAMPAGYKASIRRYLADPPRG
jgi:8-oxo-dGTP pyrophosphatase MutT (NUDIX family)